MYSLEVNAYSRINRKLHCAAPLLGWYRAQASKQASKLSRVYENQISITNENSKSARPGKTADKSSSKDCLALQALGELFRQSFICISRLSVPNTSARRRFVINWSEGRAKLVDRYRRYIQSYRDERERSRKIIDVAAEHCICIGNAKRKLKSKHT